MLIDNPAHKFRNCNAEPCGLGPQELDLWGGECNTLADAAHVVTIFTTLSGVKLVCRDVSTANIPDTTREPPLHETQ